MAKLVVLSEALKGRSYELKTVLTNAHFVIEGYVDPPPPRYGAASPLGEPKHREGFLGDYTGYYTLPEPYPVFHATAIRHRQRDLQACCTREDAVVCAHDNDCHREQSGQHPAGHCARV